MNPFSLLSTRLAHYPTIHRAAVVPAPVFADTPLLLAGCHDPFTGDAIEFHATGQPYGLPVTAAAEILPMIGEGHGEFDDGTPYYVPFVARLPFGRGWLAGCGGQPIEDDGTALYILDLHIYPTEQQAAAYADTLAEQQWSYLLDQ